MGCSFSQNGSLGIEVRLVNAVTLFGCTMRGNRGGVAANSANGLVAVDCERLDVRSCVFEDADTLGTGPNRAQQFARIENCPGAIIDGGWVDGLPDDPNPKQPE